NHVVVVNQSGLGLPDRDYYLGAEPRLEAVRTAYRAYMTKLMTLAGEANADARVAAVFEFEKALAGVHWARVDLRNADKTYNKWTTADFETQAQGYPWKAHRAALGIADQPFYVVGQPSAMTGEAKLFAAT